MDTKKLEYMDKDVPTIKKDLVLRIVFAVLFAVSFAWQLVAMILSHDNISVIMLVLSSVTMIFSIMFGFASILYAIKDLKILEKIRLRGKSINNVNFVFNIEKRSFIHLYSFITSILAIIATFLLFASLTYSVLAYIYYNTISFYLPTVLAFVSWCYNSSYHLKNEIYISQNVAQFNSMFY